jgi:ribosome biogenesis protein BMS1
VHGFPKVMGVLTHLDGFPDQARLKKTKKKLKARFWAEIYDGAKLFYLSGVQHGKYLKREVTNLARFISVMKFRPLTWRLAHPYLLADRFEARAAARFLPLLAAACTAWQRSRARISKLAEKRGRALR